MLTGSTSKLTGKFGNAPYNTKWLGVVADFFFSFAYLLDIIIKTRIHDRRSWSILNNFQRQSFLHLGQGFQIILGESTRGKNLRVKFQQKNWKLHWNLNHKVYIFFPFLKKQYLWNNYKHKTTNTIGRLKYFSV